MPSFLAYAARARLWGGRNAGLENTQGLLATLRCRGHLFCIQATDTLSEWLSRWTRNPLCSARKGSNPLGVALLARLRGWSLEATPVALADKAEEHRSNQWCSWRLASMPVEERRALRGKPERRHCLWPTSSKGACSVAATYKPACASGSTSGRRIADL